jgi:pimeloyl-ACP methyl ester carboxylesterase
MKKFINLSMSPVCKHGNEILRRASIPGVLMMLLIAGCSNAPTPPVVSEDLVLRSPAAGAKAEVIFIHGVLGDPVLTFGSTDSNWPLLLAKDSLIGAPLDVRSIGYSSKPIGAASNINEIANRLTLRLIDQEVFDQHEKVIFVVHSMGGLIAKRMLVQLRTDHPQLFSKVAGIVFLATPSGGSSLADTARWVSGNPQFEDMRPEDVNTLLQVLEDDWQALLRSRDPDTRLIAFCVYETQALGPVTVVPRSRSQSGCDERPTAFDRNHSSLVKPASREDEVYRHVAARIKRLLADPQRPLTIEASILGQNNKPLDENPVLHSGSQFSISIKTNRPAWFYVVGQDSTGKAQRYFPSELAGTQSLPQSAMRIPSDTDDALVLDNNTGVERIHVFATSEPSKEIQELMEGIESLSSSAAGDVLDDAVAKRGAYVAKADGPPEPVASQQLAISPEVARTLLIEHR